MEYLKVRVHTIDQCLLHVSLYAETTVCLTDTPKLLCTPWASILPKKNFWGRGTGSFPRKQLVIKHMKSPEIVILPFWGQVSMLYSVCLSFYLGCPTKPATPPRSAPTYRLFHCCSSWWCEQEQWTGTKNRNNEQEQWKTVLFNLTLLPTPKASFLGGRGVNNQRIHVTN